MEITKEWIAQQREICEIAIMVYEDAPACAVPLLQQLEKSLKAAIDALEAARAENAALREQNARLTAERDAQKRGADAGAIRTAVRPFDKGDEHTLTKFTQFCKRLAALHKPDMPSEDRMLLLLTDLCIDRLCVSMQGLTAELAAEKRREDAAVKDIVLTAYRENKMPCAACAKELLLDAPSGAESEGEHAE